MSKRPILWKVKLASAFSTLALIFLVVGTLMRFIPSESALGPFARLLDSASPHFIFLSITCSILTASFGMRRVACALAIVAMIFAMFQFLDHLRISLPLASDKVSDIKILFLNVFRDNENGSSIIETALSYRPDIIVFAESSSVQSSLVHLKEEYLFLSPCDVQNCELLIATKSKPKRFWTLTLNAVWDNRYAVAEIDLSSGKSFFLAANHLSKPWLSGVAESEIERLVAQYNWLSGPSVVVGDFNAAPWSRPMMHLLSSTQMRTLRAPKGTWPTSAGGFGIPIDHVLVKNGARIVSIEYFGEDLGSNHRGFVAEVALP